MKAIFLGSSRYICVHCNKCYKNKRSLQTHLKMDCGKDRKFACPECPYACKRKYDLKTHFYIRHYNTLDKI